MVLEYEFLNNTYDNYHTEDPIGQYHGECSRNLRETTDMAGN